MSLSPNPETYPTDRCPAEPQDGYETARTSGPAVCTISILGDTASSALFLGPIAPEGVVSFGSLAGTVEVSFSAGSPLVGVNQSLRIAPGPSVPFAIRPDAAGEFPFTMRSPDLDRTLYLAVDPQASIHALGFRAGALGNVVLETFARSTDRQLRVILTNKTGESARVGLLPYGGSVVVRDLAPGQSSSELFPFAVFGSVLTVSLDPETSVIDQSGGTEQIEIILEPD